LTFILAQIVGPDDARLHQFRPIESRTAHVRMLQLRWF